MKFTKKELTECLGEIRGQRIRFNMPVEFEQLLFNRSGIEKLNEMVDLFVEDGYLLEDISYTPVKLEKDRLFIEVDAYMGSWLKGHI